MDRRPVKKAIRASPTIGSQAVALAILPAVYAFRAAFRLSSWCYGQAAAALQLPSRALVASLELVSSLICDILTFITKQPSPRAQISSYQQKVSQLQQQTKAQLRQVLSLQNELNGVKLEKSKLQLKNLELSDTVQALQLQLAKQAATAAAATADAVTTSQGDKKAAATQQQARHARNSSNQPQPNVSGVMCDAQGWYLHACVLLAALAVRWWLTNQTDPLQRKVMLVIIWPVAWLYGAMVFKCVPRSSTLRAAMACCCWALLGYVANEMVSSSVRERQQLVCHSVS